MVTLYLMLLVMVPVTAALAGWDFKALRWQWGVFWLTMSVVMQVLVVTSYDTFVA